jgi:flagellar biosynthetic protein FliR
MTFTAAAFDSLLVEWLATYLWPSFRIGGLLMVAPLFGARLVPARIRIVLVLAVTVVIAPFVTAPTMQTLSVQGVLIVMQEVMLGAAMGFTLQMIFDALVIAGQTIAMTMGLGFAMMVDPQRGVSIPVISQFFVILGMLIFVSLDGHLALLQLLSGSYAVLPIGTLIGPESIWTLLLWAATMFAGAIKIALPAVAALLLVNLAFSVMSRAAPTLNLFSIGFPAAMLLAFIFMFFGIKSLDSSFAELLDVALATVSDILSAAR